MKVVKSTEIRVEVPAGTYFLGDPCYAVPDELWIPLLESCDYFNINDPVGTINGYSVLGFGTRYGDGVYKDQYGNTYGVDAGLIGLVPEALALQGGQTVSQLAELGTWVEFVNPTICTSNRDGGTLKLGRHIIVTDEGGME